jgi:hypothetical protein
MALAVISHLLFDLAEELPNIAHHHVDLVENVFEELDQVLNLPPQFSELATGLLENYQDIFLFLKEHSLVHGDKRLAAAA